MDRTTFGLMVETLVATPSTQTKCRKDAAFNCRGEQGFAPTGPESATLSGKVADLSYPGRSSWAIFRQASSSARKCRNGSIRKGSDNPKDRNSAMEMVTRGQLLVLDFPK